MKLRNLPLRFWVMIAVGAALMGYVILIAVGVVPNIVNGPPTVLLLAFVGSVIWNVLSFTQVREFDE